MADPVQGLLRHHPASRSCSRSWGGGLSVGDITAVVGCTQSAVSHQLRTLKQARLVKATRDGKNVIYALSDDHVYTMLAQGMTHVCE